MERICVKNYEMRNLPNFYKFSKTLSNLLDIEHPVGNDYRLVLELLGLSSQEIRFLGERIKRPTVEALENWSGSIGDFVEVLRCADRADCIEEVSRYLSGIVKVDHYTGSYVRGGCQPVQSHDRRNAVDIDALLNTVYSPPCDSRCRVTPSKDVSWRRQSMDTFCTWMISMIKSFFSIAKDLTWISSTTVHVNNFARCFFVLMVLFNIGECIFFSNLYHWLELVIAVIPVIQSEHVDKVMGGNYRELIKEIRDAENNVAHYQSLLGTSMSSIHGGDTPGDTVTHRRNSNCETESSSRNADVLADDNVDWVADVLADDNVDWVMGHASVAEHFDSSRTTLDQSSVLSSSSSVSQSEGSFEENETIRTVQQYYKEIQGERRKIDELVAKVQPTYSDLRFCLFSTFLIEVCIFCGILLHFILFCTLDMIHQRFSDGFTALAYFLLVLDGFYNFMIIAVYYHDSTPTTVVKRNRFCL